MSEEFVGRVVRWDAKDERCKPGETMMHIIVSDEDIHDGRVPWPGRFITAAEAGGES